MGLCKCARKRVTNQFCFEHKVNVCEHCMVQEEHEKCIVGPYMQWLDNSSFDPNCHFCRTSLAQANCVRLCCYHVFHLECLNNHALQLPSTTAPAGYCCQICSTPIFSLIPGSPVSAKLEEALSTFAWARDGIGKKIINDDKTNTILPHNGLVETKNNRSAKESTKIDMIHMGNGYSRTSDQNKLNNLSTPMSTNTVTSFISTNSDLSFGSTSSMRSKFDESRRFLLSTVDDRIVSDDKYRTKSPIEFLSRWLRTRTTFIKNQPLFDKISPFKRFIVLGIIIVLIVFFLIHLFVKYGRESAESDPFLELKNDPNFRNAEE